MTKKAFRGLLRGWKSCGEPRQEQTETIRFRMDQDGLTQRDLEVYIGPSGRVSEVLNKRRPLTIGMVKRFHNGLNIPYESLLAD